MSPSYNFTNVQQPMLTTLGTAVIDELRFSDDSITKNVLGGSGVYFAVGARLFLSGTAAKNICGLLHVGKDFPTCAEHHILSWKSNLQIQSSSEFTAANVVTFTDAAMDHRTRNYLHPSIFTRPADLPEHAINAKTFHLIGPPTELHGDVETMMSRRSLSSAAPLIIWEPWPMACIPANFDETMSVLNHVDVFSPNHLELMSLFGYPSEEFSKDLIETLARQCLSISIRESGNTTVIVRCGEHGSHLAEAEPKAEDGRIITNTWIPPFHGDANKVVSTVGSGNAFLGGLAVGWEETKDWLKACCYGSVASSFVIEQVSLPICEGFWGIEVWNGQHVRSRLRIMLEELDIETRRVVPDKVVE
jgi:sugar/nucleoside kinase (ribokinase family)